MGIFGNNNNQVAPVVDQTTTATNDQNVSIDGVLPASQAQDNSAAQAPSVASTIVPVEDYIMTDPVAAQPTEEATTEPASDAGEQPHISPAYNDMVGAPSAPEPPEVSLPEPEAQVDEPLPTTNMEESYSESVPEPMQPEFPEPSQTENMGYTDLSTHVVEDMPTENTDTPEVASSIMTEDAMPQVFTGRGGLSSGSGLDDIKQQALQQLTPLISHLNQTPEEKFNTTMMMIQATDDKSLIAVAYEAAQSISDEQVKAQALLAIVNEINYFANSSN